MLSRIVMKRYCHTHGRSKCYENLHKIDALRQEVREIKELLQKTEEATTIIYGCTVVSLLGTLALLSK